MSKIQRSLASCGGSDVSARESDEPIMMLNCIKQKRSRVKALPRWDARSCKRGSE